MWSNNNREANNNANNIVYLVHKSNKEGRETVQLLKILNGHENNDRNICHGEEIEDTSGHS